MESIVIETIRILLKIFKAVLKYGIRILKFTGLWIFILGLFILDKTQHIKALSPLLLIMLIAMLVMPVYITATNIVRMITKNPDFNFREYFYNKKKTETTGTGGDAYKVRKPEGFIFGKIGSKYVSKPELQDGHIAVLGGAGSGKSSAIAIPSLISWQESIFAIDIKGELTQKTKSFREKKGYTVKVLNPVDLNSYGFDPFEIFKTSRNIVQDTRDIVNAIIPIKPDEKDPFWTESAQNILSASILYAYDNELTFTNAIELITSNPLPVFFELVDESDSKQAKMFISQLKGLKEQTLSSIGQTLSNRILPFATDTDLISVFSRKENISPNDLEGMNDIYIQIPEDKIEQWQSLLTLIVNTFLKAFERRDEVVLAETPKPILFALDEFPRLGKVQAITNGLATLRSKQITIALFMQSMAQLDLIYGKETRQVIFDNCQYKAILRATDQDTQEYLSKLVGTYDKEKTSTSANFGAITQHDTGSGTTKTTEEKRIIKPEEFSTLEDIVLLTPEGFQRIEKASYWKDKNFH